MAIGDNSRNDARFVKLAVHVWFGLLFVCVLRPISSLGIYFHRYRESGSGYPNAAAAAAVALLCVV